MDKDKVVNLARSFSSTCNKLTKDKSWLQQISSPATTIIAMTILKTMLLDIGINKRPGWGFQV
jgi:hypothetical protein